MKEEQHNSIVYKLTESAHREFAKTQGYNPDALSAGDMDMLSQRWNIVKGGNSTMLAWPSFKRKED